MAVNNHKVKNIYMIGCGGHAKVVLAACQSSHMEVRGFFDENSNRFGALFEDIKIDPIPEALWWKNQYGMLAMGENRARKRLSELIFPKKWATIIHPTALVHPTASIGEGTYIGAFAVIQPHVSIGQHVIINTGAIVEHDTHIGSFCHIAPRTVLSGGVCVGEGTLIGAGSTAIPEIEIGCWSTIGAGSVMIRNIDSHSLAVGVPCRILSSQL